MKSIAIFLMIAGAILLLIGIVLFVSDKAGLPLGKLPGDVHLEGKRWSVFVPVTTCIVLSLLLTLLLNLFFRR